MSSKPFFTDEQVKMMFEYDWCDLDGMLVKDLQRARAEARGRKADQLRLTRERDCALKRCTELPLRMRQAIEIVIDSARYQKALKEITDPDLPSLATAAQIAKEALKDE